MTSPTDRVSDERLAELVEDYMAIVVDAIDDKATTEAPQALACVSDTLLSLRELQSRREAMRGVDAEQDPYPTSGRGKKCS